jgi:hypothetical protein
MKKAETTQREMVPGLETRENELVGITKTNANRNTARRALRVVLPRLHSSARASSHFCAADNVLRTNALVKPHRKRTKLPSYDGMHLTFSLFLVSKPTQPQHKR